jgi:hypothetical protein
MIAAGFLSTSGSPFFLRADRVVTAHLMNCENVQMCGMASLVIDTSAVLAVLLNEPARPVLISAREGYGLVGALSLRWEVGHPNPCSRITPHAQEGGLQQPLASPSARPNPP